MSRDAFLVFYRLREASEELEEIRTKISRLEHDLEVQEAKFDSSHDEALKIFLANPTISTVTMSSQCIIHFDGYVVSILKPEFPSSLKVPEPPAPSGDEIADQIMEDSIEVEAAYVGQLADMASEVEF